MKIIFSFIIAALIFFAFNSCGKKGGASDRNTIIAISDIHLGDKRALENNYTWFNKNTKSLIAFLDSLSKQKDIKALIIAGDLFDEWVSPIDVNTYPDGQSHSDFILSIKEANKEIIGAIAELKTKNGIDIFYVNGNHDLLVTAEDIEAVFGKNTVFYCNDFFNAQKGIGTFYDKDLKLIIEHGHRYDFFNAPYKQTIKDKNGAFIETILPPGFFAAKLSASAALSKEKGLKLEDSKTENIMEEFSQIEKSKDPAKDKKIYGFAWKVLLDFLSIKETDYKNKNIKTGIDGLEGNFSIEDFAPYLKNGALIDKRIIFKNIEENWRKTQKANGIDGIRQPFIDISKAILADGITSYFDEMAKSQYFDNDAIDIRIAVFGHSHEAKLISYYGDNPSKKSIYANSGTWIDNSKITRNYVMIKNDKKAARIIVSVRQIDEKGNITILGEDFISDNN